MGELNQKIQHATSAKLICKRVRRVRHEGFRWLRWLHPIEKWTLGTSKIYKLSLVPELVIHFFSLIGISLALVLVTTTMLEISIRCLRLKTSQLSQAHLTTILRSILVSSYLRHARHACLCLCGFTAIDGSFSFMCQKCIVAFFESRHAQE